MRVRSLRVDRWRNLRDLSIKIPADTHFVCLVGENGTGKSSVLELLTWSAHQFGLASQVALRRPAPQLIPETEIGLEVTLATERPEELRARVRGQIGDLVDDWDGDLTLVAKTWKGTTEPEIPPGVPVAPHHDGGAYTAVLAGSVAAPSARAVGSYLVEAIRNLPELLHLYIDAERVFPAADVRDEEILALARQDPTVPDWLKQQASQMTQNLYLEWMRSMLGRQQRLQSEYFQRAQQAARAGEAVPPPEDPLAHYRAGLAQVLPHLRFVRLDQDARRLVFDSAGLELPYEELSGGERELAFLVGQIDRFGLRDGLFLLDEPELHLNPELLRGWLDYLRSTVGSGQAWVATHSLEAAEVAGPSSTLVLERDDDRLVRRAPPLADRPALTTLAAAVGTPAFSVARSRFVLIEGTRERRERERFATVLESNVADRFIEADGCTEVIARVRALRLLASEEEQLRVAGIVDRDFRTQAERAQLLETEGVHVLSVHEIENLFLQPDLLRRLLADANEDSERVLALLQQASDVDAGRWAFERTQAEEKWREDARAPLSVARGMTWSDVQSDVDGAARAIAAAIPGVEGAEAARRRLAIGKRLNEYGEVRNDPGALSERCYGKQALGRVSHALGFHDASALEARAAVLWREGQVPRPAAAGEIRAYLDSVPVLPA